MVADALGIHPFGQHVDYCAAACAVHAADADENRDAMLSGLPLRLEKFQTQIIGNGFVFLGRAGSARLADSNMKAPFRRRVGGAGFPGRTNLDVGKSLTATRRIY